MPKTLLPAAVIFLSIFLSITAYAEKIANFTSGIYVTDNGTILVTEDIEYDFQHAYRHGIYREIPFKYDYGYKRLTIDLDVEGVTDFKGGTYKYKVSKQGSYVNIRIGDPDFKVTGEHGYKIEYFVDGAVSYFDDYDEIYWNVTGNEWRVPIERSSARVSFENGVPEGARAKCFTGTYGSTDEDCKVTIKKNSIDFETLGSLDAGQGLSIVVGFPKGIVKEPGAMSKFFRFISDNWYFALPFLTGFGLFYLWRSRGKDPEGRGVIAVRYEPPENLTPAEAGTLVDERANIQDISSTVIDLAVRGYITIEEIQTTKFYFFTDRDYKLTKLKEPTQEELKPHELKVLSGIFDGSQETMISELRNKFYKELPGIKKALYKELIDNRFFPTNPESVKTIYRFIGIGILVIGFFLMFNPLLTLSLILSGIIVFIFSGFMPRKTKKGVVVKEQILGFREFIDRAEKDRIKRLAEQDPTLFDRVLPYAIVFGLEDKWADAFRGMYTEPPRWYHSSHYRDRFSPELFVNDIGRSLTVMNSTMVSTPRRSGSSGFSGGGGSSGGGFGGGGGGSW